MFVLYISAIVLCASVKLGAADSGNWGYGNGDFGNGDFGSWGGNDGGDGGSSMWNPCNQFECQNDGECYSTARGPRCVCSPMFSGPMCEIFKGFGGAAAVNTAMSPMGYHMGDLPDHLEHLGMAGFNVMGGQAPWAAQQYNFRTQGQNKLQTDPRPKQTNTVLNSMAPRRGQAGQNPLQARNPAVNAVNRRQNFQQQPARNNMAARGQGQMTGQGQGMMGQGQGMMGQGQMMGAPVGMAPWGGNQGQAAGYKLNVRGGNSGMPSSNPWGQQPQQQTRAATSWGQQQQPRRAAGPAWGQFMG